MISLGRKKGTMRFALKAEGDIKKVQVAGTFSGWEPVALRKQRSGMFVRNLELPLGKHEYKFISDGRWHHDPDNEDSTCNEHGSLNSLLKI